MRAAAVTAVAAGTAGAVRHHQDQKYAAQDAEQQAAAQATYEQGVQAGQQQAMMQQAPAAHLLAGAAST